MAVGEGLRTIEIGGLPFAPLRRAELLDRVFGDLAEGRGGWLVTANVDFVQRAQREPEIRALYDRATLVVADGAPLVWASKLAGTPLPERLAGSDITRWIAERAAREARSLYLLGGADDAAARAAASLSARFPSLRIAGHASPWIGLPPTAAELDALADEIVPCAPDFLYVAFGSPKQEYVIAHLRALLPGTWMIGCGISLSFIAGGVSRAPVWMQRSGLEWLHRIGTDPRRLARRYLLDNLPFALRLLAASVRQRLAR